PVMGEQVHGQKISLVGAKQVVKVLAGVDGLVTSEPGVCLAIRTADCVPLLAVDPLAKRIGLAHAGWRGLVRGVVANLIGLMKLQGSRPANIWIGTGPYLSSCCCKFTEPELGLVRKKFPHSPQLFTGTLDNPMVDLGGMVVVEAVKAGVKKENVWQGGSCTYCQPGFYSFRRQKNQKDFGEFLTVGMIKPAEIND
ncbi:polyphenol oxidase family protein, partial [Patescibacteria group bacterium]|nr:polyphenol oxidase family protein [Patescibacteria group bacterium]